MEGPYGQCIHIFLLSFFLIAVSFEFSRNSFIMVYPKQTSGGHGGLPFSTYAILYAIWTHPPTRFLHVIRNGNV